MSWLGRVPEWGHIAVKGTKAYLYQALLYIEVPAYADRLLQFRAMSMSVICKNRLFVCLTDTLHNQQLIFPVNILRWREVGVAIDTIGRQRFTGLVLPGRSPIYMVIEAVWMPAGMPIITW